MISKQLERSLKDKKIGMSYLCVTLEGTKKASIGSQVVQEGIKFLKKGTRATSRSIQEEDSKAKDISDTPRVPDMQHTHPSSECSACGGSEDVLSSSVLCHRTPSVVLAWTYHQSSHSSSSWRSCAPVTLI